MLRTELEAFKLGFEELLAKEKSQKKDATLTVKGQYKKVTIDLDPNRLTLT